jgi:hypothetical protein
MLTIKILGVNSPYLAKIEEHTVTAMGWLRPHAGYQIEKVTDAAEIRTYTDKRLGLVINDRIVCEGQIPAANEVVTWASDAIQTALESRDH